MPQTSSPPAIRLVAFDLAGTTVDFGSSAPAGVFVDLFARHGVTVGAAEARPEFVVVKRGDGLRITRDDSLYFDAATPHRLTNPWGKPAEVLCVFHGRAPRVTRPRPRKARAAR